MESGTVMWTGTSHYPQAINNPEAGIVYLTQSALRRGLCPAEAWISDKKGCDVAKAFGTGMVGFLYEWKNTPESRQLLITFATPNSPAEQAGLRVGDVLLSCNGRSGFQNQTQFRMACRVDDGQPVTLQVKRGDKLTTISATAVSRTKLQK